MKEKTFLILWLLFLGILVSPSAWGQYFNYASAYTGNQTTDYQSLIRKIDDTSVQPLLAKFSDIEDRINAIQDSRSKIENHIYNLIGQRLSGMQKGINIVAGKKILK